MKLWQCDWVPSSVADWLCRELDERGIPGTTYTHTLLSLLHPYFCPHPIPKESGHLPKGFINLDCISSFSNSGPPHEFEEFFESLEDHVHPDADFPELKVSEPVKESNRRHKKRQKRKLQQLSQSPEKLWKVIALQCLLSASDEENNLESVIEELFLRLKESHNSVDEKEIKLNCINLVANNENSESVEAVNCSSESDFSKRFYSSNFPPLSSKKTDEEPVEDHNCTLSWKSLIKEKLTPEKSPPVQECSQSGVDVENDSGKNLLKPLNSSLCAENKAEKLEMEIRTSSFENGTLENKAYCFIPIFREESEECKSEDLPEIGVSDGNVYHPLSSNCKGVGSPKEKEKLEEWECAGNFLAEPVDRAVSVDVLGNRLYERSIGSAEATRCNSNTDFNTLNFKSEDEKNRELNVSNPLSSVWDLPESWKKQQSECGTVWNSSFNHQAYNNLNKSNIDSVNSGLSVCEDKLVSEKNELDIISKNPLTDSWPPPNTNWNSLPLIDPKIDPVFSSAFHCSPNAVYREVVRQDSKIPIPQISNENLKNIWSDFNDNITTDRKVENNKIDRQEHSPIDLSNFSRMSIQDDNGEEKLCKSFRQLGLEQLWQDSMLIDSHPDESRVIKSLTSDDTSGTFFEDPSKCEREQLSSEELYRLKFSQHKEIDDRFLFHKIPSGPSGPYVDLRHTESSGFSAVIPHDKNLQVDSENVCEQGGSLPITPKSLHESLDRNLTTQDEENLLTSPRTHFRPIRQDSHGSIDDSSKSEDGQAVINTVTNVQDPNLVFQRSGSGTLYLESDLLKGSPKKYMAYREPPAKPPVVTNPNDSHEYPVLPVVDDSPTNVFVPKFKIVNNEKFCQTEEPEVSKSLGESISKELDSKILGNEIQKYDYIYQSSEQPWDDRSYQSNIKRIWGEEPTKSEAKEAWELELGGPAISYPKWSTHDLSQTDWSNNCQVQPMQDSASNKSIFKHSEESKSRLNSNEDTLSKIKFIWHNSKDKRDSKVVGTSASISINDLSSSEFLQPRTFSESWDGQQSKDIDSQKEMPNLSSSLVIPKSPWNIELDLQKDEKDFKSLNQEEHMDIASRWQLQWEVDQEADEILGGLLPPSPLKSSPPYESPLKTQGIPQTDLEEFSFLDFLECQDQQQPIEDLDNLEPGWDLNEGFEWGPASEDIFQGDEDDGNGREVLIYKNEEGQTVMLPVEYLDDNLYDQIFGSIDTPIGGSLPDLPGGQMSEFKKGTLSYKLSRRSRGDKFVPPSRRPCSFFLEGNCRRSDCKFSHDLLTITCRFWEEGSCLKGDNCPFRHGFLPSRRRNRSEGDQASVVPPVSFASLKEGNSSNLTKGKPIPRKSRSSAPSVSSFELDSETDFPCLGSSVESKIGSLDEQSFPSNIKVTRLSKKKKKYITVTKNLFKEMESDRAKGNQGKGSRRSKGASRSNSFDSVSGAPDGGGSGSTNGTGVGSGKKKSKEKGKEGKECETLRKVLRKRYPVSQQHPFSHEDGTLSDF